MANLTHWNPFKNVARLDTALPVDNLLRSLGLNPAWREFDVAPDIRVDVTEDEKSFRIKAEIPGVEKKDIDISVEGNQVAISAEIRRETKNKEGEKELFTDRYFGKVYRAFSLPTDLDASKADARYENGVLTLAVPKKGNGSSKKIAVA